MKGYSYLFLIVCLLFINCSSKTNNPEFVKIAKGRYLYNADEVIEVYFNNNQLFLKWRGATKIKPLKIDENTFYVKEMNEKITFKKNPLDQKEYLVLVPKKEKDSIQYIHRKLNKNEKTPHEYLIIDNFDKALEGYQLIKKNDSLNPLIEEAYLNRLGYKELKEKNYKKALYLFKINMALYPKSSNVYDSYADGLNLSGDTINAIEYYKKSLVLNAENTNAKKQLERLQKQK